MIESRVWLAVALLGFAACSFPDYAVSEPLVQVHSCVDRMRNGDETGVDCGGPSCGPCPSCDDEQQNGDESDVDCGGTCATRCATDQRCRESADCSSLVCDEVCQPSSCADGTRNGAETGVDCGGGCPACTNGMSCKVDADCVDRRCQEGVCVSAGCTDRILNGQESDTDCGGADCARCPPDRGCRSPDDCDSRVCNTAGACVAASCADKVLNQGETDADCGGPDCASCGVGQTCAVGGDCESELCRNGTCVPAEATGEQLSRSKWKLVSSEPETETETAAALDGRDDTAWTSGKTQYSGMYVDLDLGKTEIFFRALLKVTASPYSDDFPGSIEVYVSNDGTFGTPSLGSLRGDQWTWCTFNGAQVGRYLRFVITEPKARSWSIGEIQVLK